MGRILFYLFVRPLSFLPLGVLQLMSNGLYYILYYLVRYRRKVVAQNLSNSFPESSDTEIREISKSYYRYLGDLIVETLKLFSLGKNKALQRCSITFPNNLKDHYEQGRSIVLYVGHYGNWEHYCKVLDLYVPHQVVILYKPLHNKAFDEAYNRFRTALGTQMIPIKETRKIITALKEKPIAIVFAGDQSPTFNKKVHWDNFLNQDTAWATGGEYFAKKFNLPVYYMHATFPKRGYYNVDLQLLEASPQSTLEGELTTKYSRALEKQIQDQPEYWIWSHRRWKRKR